MDKGDEEEEEDDDEGGLAMESIPWMASRVLGEAGASSLRKVQSWAINNHLKL